MSLRPFANLFAFAHEDPRVLAALERRLRASREFALVWSPHPSWLCASAPLPHAEPDDGVVRGAGLAFAEGRERMERALARERERSLAALAERAQRAPERLVELPGDFGFLAFDREGALHAVRACAGLVPFYYARRGPALALATRLEYMVRFVDPDAALDPLPNAAWLVSATLFPDGRTFLRGVSALPAGSCTRLALREEPTSVRYWSPQTMALSAPTHEKQEEHVRRLRALLLQQLASDLTTEGSNLLSLSGGVDSSSLAALAASELHRPLRTLSFVPSPPALARRSEHYLDALGARFPLLEQLRKPLDPHVAFELRKRPSPALFHVPHPVLIVLPELLRGRDIRVLVGGEYADDTVGARLSHADWARHTSLLGLALHTVRTGRLRDVRTWLARTAYELRSRPTLPIAEAVPSFVRPGVQGEYTAWRAQLKAHARRERAPRTELAARLALEGPVTMNWEVASALGVRRSFPFFHRALHELAYELHPGELRGGCNDKRLLRRALDGHVPELHLQRPDKGEWGPGFSSFEVDWTEPLPDALAPVVGDAWWPRPPARLPISVALPLQQLVSFASALQQARERARAEAVASSRTTGPDHGTTQRYQSHTL